MNKKKGKLATGLNQKWILFIRKIMFCFLMNATTVYIIPSKLDKNIEYIEGLFSLGGLFSPQHNIQIYCDLVQLTYLN